MSAQQAIFTKFQIKHLLAWGTHNLVFVPIESEIRKKNENWHLSLKIEVQCFTDIFLELSSTKYIILVQTPELN